MTFNTTGNLQCNSASSNPIKIEFLLKQGYGEFIKVTKGLPLATGNCVSPNKTFNSTLTREYISSREEIAKTVNSIHFLIICLETSLLFFS